MSNLEKYRHKALNNRAGKWRDMALSNLAKELTQTERDELLATLPAELLAQQQAQHDKLAGLQAPMIIMDRQRKLLEQIQSGKSPVLAILRRASKV